MTERSGGEMLSLLSYVWKEHIIGKGIPGSKCYNEHIQMNVYMIR